MTQAYQELRETARALALATLFDKPDERDVICDLLQLGLELEKILEIASEPMLAMIRMQWWVDLFDNASLSDEAPDFAKRLYNASAIPMNDILSIVQQTQDSLQSPNPEMAWDRLFIVMAHANGWQIEEAVLRRLGHNLGALYQEEGAYQPLDDSDIKTASSGTYGFPRLVNLLVSRQIAGKPNQDFLLIFRYLWRVLF